MANLATNTGKAFQNASTFLFVPQAFGAADTTTDDTNTPGAYFRLGGFSDIEDAAAPTQSAPDGLLTSFYPRQHIHDSTKANAVAHAAGSASDKRGIMLSCSGRLLIRSAEKTYLHSVEDIHIDTQATLKIKAEGLIEAVSDDTVTLKSGTNKDFTISAGGGTGKYSQKAVKNVKEVNGNDYELTDSDSFKYYKCNVYTYKIGGLVDVNMGGAFAFWLGDKLSIAISIDMSISLASTFAFWYYKFDLGVVKMDFYQTKLEFKDGKFSVAAWKGDNYLVASATAIAKTAVHGVKSAAETIKSTASNISTGLQAMSAITGGPSIYTMGMIGIM